jgi:hypothetical protein
LRSHESLDEKACSWSEVPTFGGGEHNILTAFIQGDPDFASTAQNPGAFFRYIRFADPFESL